MRLVTAIFLALAPVALVAQTPGTCAPGGATALLDVNDVEARLFNRGNLFYGESAEEGFFNSAYHVPKEPVCGGGDSPCSALYAADLWIGGRVDSELRVAGATFSQFEFWPGPLDDGATLPNPSDCSAYDRIFVVSRDDVAHYLETGEATDDLRDWPVDLGAPVLDGDGIDGNYDLAAGDQPAIYGDQTAWWVMNDVGNVHEGTGSDSLGLEVQVTAFAMQSEKLSISQATLYRYRIINRNTQAIDSTYVSFFWDTDLGDASNDWMGTDTTRALVYAYNAEQDVVYTGDPPAFGARILESPRDDDGAPLGLSTSMTLINASSEITDPRTAEEFYNVMQGRWRDDTPVTASGDGYNTGGPEVHFMLPGDPVEGACWSAVNDCEGGSVTPANRRAVASTGPFRLDAGEAEEFVVALVFAQGQDSDPVHVIPPLRGAADVVQGAWNTGWFDPTRITAGASAELPDGVELARPYPNPFVDRLTLRYALPAAMPLRVTVLDILGREVAVLTSGDQPAGPRAVELDTDRLASGLYLVRFEVGTEVRAFPVIKAQ